MIKIKDDVDLKELEKYNFYPCNGRRIYRYEIDYSEQIDILEDRQIRLFITDEYYYNWTSERSFDVIYDLIKANLVEKVKE